MSHLAYTYCEARLFQQSPEVHSKLTSLLYNYWNDNINQSHNEYISISLVLPNKKTRDMGLLRSQLMLQMYGSQHYDLVVALVGDEIC